jgi:2-polyprenyl-6-methoxyphenol hydroxylase-like FAD-dependent oxidoreductase
MPQAEQSDVQTIQTQCCVVGGGPAGMMLGYLMARAGVETVVLEKHADFLRDFRGDTVHPSTLQIMHELGLLDEFLQCPHTEVRQVRVEIGASQVQFADFTHLPTAAKFLAFMPQWDFLNFLLEKGRRFPNLKVIMRAEATGLVEQDGRVAGVMASAPEGPLRVMADLTVGCDGRGSRVRELAGLKVRDLGAPIDVLWFRLPKKSTDPELVLGHLERGTMVVTLDRGDYWQCAFVIPKGGMQELRDKGLEAFRQQVARGARFLADRVDLLADLDDIKLLSVEVNRLEQWCKPGLLCIGDAAHAMSPVGGVGINLAIQDAVATANALAAKMQPGRQLELADLDAVRRRRLFPARAVQGIQVFVHKKVLSPMIAGGSRPLAVPWPVRLLNHVPALRRLMARAIGLGVRPEHVQSPEMRRTPEGARAGAGYAGRPPAGDGPPGG